MQPLLKILLWVFLWPVKLPVWLWQHETIGKVSAILWITCLLIIGLGLLPRPAERVEHPPATPELTGSLQSILLSGLRKATPGVSQNNGQTSTGLTATETSLVIPAVITQPPTPTVISTLVDLPLATVTPTLIIDLAVSTATPLLMPTPPALTATATQLPVSIATEKPAPPPTSIPTVTPFYTPALAPTSEPIATPTVLAPASTTSALASNSSGFTCVGGCSEAPDPSCAIKGNVNAKGDKIYHIPGGKNYDLTRIKPAEGDRWFCTEQEAQDAGFRAAKSY